MDTSGVHVPDAFYPLAQQLKEALVLEQKYQPNLQLPSTAQNDEITIGARDGAAHVLRCLKVWYDLPSDVFFVAINLMDRFLTKMKARPKYMACISVSAFHIAAIQLGQSLDADHLVSISQCECTVGDLKRMSEVIRNKLEWAPGTQPITPLTFLRLFNSVLHVVAAELAIGEIYSSMVTESELLLRLEMIACDGNCASLRPSVVALVLLCTYLDTAVSRLEEATNIVSGGNSSNSSNSSSSGGGSGNAVGLSSSTGVNVMMKTNNASSAIPSLSGPVPVSAENSAKLSPSLAPVSDRLLGLLKFPAVFLKECNISDSSFYSTHEVVGAILNKYNAQEQTPHRQRLIWRLSSRTARLLRPTDKFISVLPVIAEHGPIPSPSKIRKNRKFARRHGNSSMHMCSSSHSLESTAVQPPSGSSGITHYRFPSSKLTHKFR